MTTYRRSTDRMDFIIEEDCKRITIHQKWNYNFINARNTSSWTATEEKNFHVQLNALVADSWGDSFSLKVKGNSEFAKRNIKTRWKVVFDIEWVKFGEHWTVNLTKYPKGHKIVPSRVFWGEREIKIDTNDTRTENRFRDNVSYKQQTILHEFGHAIGNVSIEGKGDEFWQRNNHYSDGNSIMNIGNQIRERHLDYVIEELNHIIPFSKFNIY